VTWWVPAASPEQAGNLLACGWDSLACIPSSAWSHLPQPVIEDIIRAVSQKTFAGPTRAFALPGLRANAALSFLGCLRLHGWCDNHHQQALHF